MVETADIQDRDSGFCYTIKEYESKKSEDDNGWKHEVIVLKPISSDPSYENIYLKEDDLLSFKIIGIFEFIIE
ncbi:hypothetical protein [Tenacibaculum agarivorans]|uniref:hypothetical protein n=1 Tax=Tenacibaculum agarivorans TaxID=1908389 RepID=UPI00094BC60D|nr:hypothetical protein [Tenacibaculum agarivorans]